MRDILLDDNYEVMTDGGDFATGTSDYQHQALILQSRKGEWKQHPMLGAGIGDMVNDERTDRWKAEMIDQLESDNMIVKAVNVTLENIEIDARYR